MITQRIFDWAEKTPDKTALIHNGVPMSYRSFAHWIAMARSYFFRRGYVGGGHAVLIVPNLTDFWVLSLALRSLGLTTVAVPSATELVQLGLPDVRCVVTSALDTWPGLAEQCATAGLPLLSVSLGGEAPLGLDAGATASPPGGHILRTSGTTGAYKMVLMSPECDAVMLRRKVEVLDMNQDTVLCVFDFPGWTGVGYRWAASPWTVGGAIVIEQGPALHRALLCPGITHAVLVPAVLARILAAPEGAFPRNDAIRLAVGGGAMTRTQVEQTKARITRQLSNWLASTEAGGIALTPLETPDDHRWHRLVPDRVVEVVDDFGRPVPARTVGRVRVLADGGPTSYLHDEAATRAFFGNGYFYPGDLGVIGPDGRLALQGRLTDVINMRGAKFSPAPTEDRLCEVLGVSAVCLFSMQNDAGEEELHAVVETANPIDRQRLAAALAQERLDFPCTRVHFIAALARNDMGKVVRRAVRAQVVARQAAQDRAEDCSRRPA